jgi:hypothetical protein
LYYAHSARLLPPIHHGPEWAALVAHPPNPKELKQELERFRPAFILDDGRFPAMQVRPALERLAETVEPKPRRGRTAPEGTDEEDGSGLQPISALLPDAPTDNVVTKDLDFFVKRDTVGAISAGAIRHNHMHSRPCTRRDEP